MSKVFGRYGLRNNLLARAACKISHPFITAFAANRYFFTLSSDYAQERSDALKVKLAKGEKVWLLGIGAAGHNSGAALIEVSAECGVNLVRNHEEERYTNKKNCSDFPQHSLDAVMRTAAGLGVQATDIHACLASWDYVKLATTFLGAVCSELPESWIFLDAKQFEPVNLKHIWQAARAPVRLGKQLGLAGALPIIGMPHHGNHAYYSYAVSPFAETKEPVLVTVIDGFSDEGAISIYLARDGLLTLLYRNQDIFDSLGGFYSMISSTQGGWTMLSSEGRYMGAVAWGDSNRMTNPFYKQLRQIFHYAPKGRIHLNRALANWPRRLLSEPYKRDLIDILGLPIPLKEMWNPDSVLRVGATEEQTSSADRFDKAAATQMVFEDALFHIVDYHIRETGSSRMVLTGGTALNALANMKLLECFDANYYRRALGQAATYLHIWVPPVPSDPGAVPGAAFQFAMKAGAKPGLPQRHAFYCGEAPTDEEIEDTLRSSQDIGWVKLGSTTDPKLIADFVASVVAQDGILGLFQGLAETGPRALGHRSILANPCNVASLEAINRLVKFREPFRPLAPMATIEAAQRLWELREGASDDDYNAYNYMVLTARARPNSYNTVPAVIHLDNTSRIQIVRADTDPFMHACLRSMGRYAGTEVLANTSFNIAGPIVQTPEQALEALRRSRAMDGVVMIGSAGNAFLAWHVVTTPPKDGGRRLNNWLDTWRADSR